MPSIHEQIDELMQKIHRELTDTGAEAAYQSFRSVACEKDTKHHPTRNSIEWARSSWNILNECIYAYASMVTHAAHYLKNVPEKSAPSHTNLLVSYFADDCAVRLDAFKDKVALAAQCLYETVDPTRRVDICQDVIKQLRARPRPTEGRDLWTDQIIATLETLTHGSWDLVEKIRTIKIHRLEPRIELYGVKPFHYDKFIAMADGKTEARLKDEIQKAYGTGRLANMLLQGCRVDGVLYAEVNADTVFSYDEVKESCRECIEDAAKAMKVVLQFVEAELTQI